MARRKLILEESTSEDDFQQRFEQYVPRDSGDFMEGRELGREEEVPSSDHTPSPVQKRYVSDEEEEEEEEEEDVGGSDRIPSLSDEDLIDNWCGSNGDSSFRVRQRGAEGETGEKQRRKRKRRKVVLDSDQDNGVVSEGKVKGAVNNKAGANRLWSEEDEVAILKGMLSYRADGGDIAHVSANISAFHGHIKNVLKIGVSDTQLKDKIKRMKKKYRNNAAKADSPPAFVRPHDERIFELSETVWGSRKGGKTHRKDFPMGDLWEMCPRVKEAMQAEEFLKFSVPQLGRSYVMDRMRNVGVEEVVEVENKWREVQKLEIEVCLMRAEAVQAQAKLILKALN